jgi:exodeoxyribonuclease V beta subunit
MSLCTWEDRAELPEGVAWLLEASAGTGKTYQIAGLFVRLVAEYEVSVERILAITFTNAAAAELRERIRLRLCDALDKLRDLGSPTEDPVIVHLRALGRAERMVSLLDLALRAFDLAPISTIHSFSQRMLQEFAFDSGQDDKLELLIDPSELLHELVDDALANLIAEVTPDELGVLEAGGVARKALLTVAKAMGDASVPKIVPEGATDTLTAALTPARAWLEDLARMRALWASDEARHQLAALGGEGKASFKGWNAGYFDASVARITDWLSSGAVETDTNEPAFRRLRPAKLRSDWKLTAPIEGRAWWPLVTVFDAFCAVQERFWASFAPLAGFARGVRARIEAELERRRALTFAAMLSRLAERVEAEGGAESPIAQRLRERFHAAFVDEFQDTDLAQWKVLEAAFLGHRRLLLIGDPKQAIYGFRGADVHVYLRAAEVVDEQNRRTMAHNWRSDPAAVAAMNHLWRAGSGAFDQAHIDYVEVAAKRPARLDPEGQGFELRWVDARALGGSPGEAIGSKHPALIARLVAREAVAWLDGERGGLRVEGDAGGDAGRKRRAFQPADLAVLVNAHHEADYVRRALERAGIRAIAASKGSIFDTPAAAWLAAWLDALAGAGRDRGARTAAVSPLFGWTADELAWALDRANQAEPAAEALEPAELAAPRAALVVRRGARDWSAWLARLGAAAARWSREGFARTFDREAVELGLYERLLRMPEGERHATDVRHLFELLHVEERSRHLGPAALAAWLRAEATVEGEPTSVDAAVQRLESDAEAVKIETVHVSKGLEYPVVLLPFVWSVRDDADKGQPIVVRGEGGAELNVETKRGQTRAAAHARHLAEQRREELRKLYVALTRAKHRTVAWFGPIGREGKAMSATALGRLLMRDRDAVGLDDAGLPVFEGKPTVGAENKAWTVAKERLDALADTSGGALAWQAESPIEAPPCWAAAPTVELTPCVAAFPSARASLIGPWRVTSYTGLVAGSAAADRDEKLSAEPRAEGLEPDDVRAFGDLGAALPAAAYATRPPLDAALPSLRRLTRGGGTVYGTWVHAVLEALDFTTGGAKDGRSAAEHVGSLGRGLGFGPASEPALELEQCLPGVLDTPLDSAGGASAVDRVRGLPAGFSLRRLAQNDRRDELAFDLRLGAGAAWRRTEAHDDAPLGALDPRPGSVDPRRVYDALLDHDAAELGVPPAWLAHQRARRDAGHALVGSIAGILTGSIDLVFRVRGPRGGASRYFLADYKTNRIGGRASSPGHYTGPWLDWEMATAGYPLQALLYTVALHRHLRTRLRGYDYDAHVGGYLYLFLRGMSGPETPRCPVSGRCLGVHGGRWPKRVIVALDDALSPTAAPTPEVVS